MTEVSLELIQHQLERVLNDVGSMRTDMDMLIRLSIRMDTTLDAVREDLRTLWSAQGDLRRRIETLERRT